MTIETPPAAASHVRSLTPSIFATRFEFGLEHRLTEPELQRLNRYDIFPFTAAELYRRGLQDPVDSEPQRNGEYGLVCEICVLSFDDATVVWEDESWMVTMFPSPRAFPSVTICPKEHQVFPYLSDELLLASGKIIQRTATALEALDGIATTHVAMRCDGTAHVHWVLIGRPYGLLQCRGPYTAVWDLVLDPMPDSLWGAVGAHVSASLSEEIDSR